MALIQFIYNGENFEIQCNINDKIKDPINRFISMNSIDKNSVIFLFSGHIINEELKI